MIASKHGGFARAQWSMPPSPATGTIRLAVVSDAHVGGEGAAVWHNQLHYGEALSILTSAVDAARANRAELLVALGDLADRGDPQSLCDVREALSAFPRRVRVVAGNHDRAQDNQSLEIALDSDTQNLRVAGSEVEDLGMLGFCGVAIESRDGGLTCSGTPVASGDWPSGLVLLASHYPALDVAPQLAEAGMRDAGLLVNHDHVFSALQERRYPTLVLNGHLHARLEHSAGSTLQLSVGALVEAPHEVTFIDIDSTGGKVEVQARRLSLATTTGRPEVTAPPILVPATTRWRWNGQQWVKASDVEQGRPVLCLDWNGTVVDDDERARRSSVDVLTELGLPVDLATVEAFRREFTLPLATFFRGLGVPDHAVNRAVTRWNELMITTASPLPTPGALQLLRWAMCHGIEIHVVSGADPRVPAADLRALMPDVRVTSIVGHAHPKWVVLDQIAARGPLVFVGDTTYDIEQGLRAGATTVGFASNPAKAARLQAMGADLVVTDLSDVQDLIAARLSNQESH